MNFLRIIWSDEEEGNIKHIDDHDLTVADVEYVLMHATVEQKSDSTNRPCVFGYTPDDEFIIVVYEWIDDETVLPITAYQVPEP